MTELLEQYQHKLARMTTRLQQGSSGSSPRKASGRSAMERTCSDKSKRWEQLVFVF